MSDRTSEEIGAFEAKTHLAELLREAAARRSFVITRRGKPLARLVPYVPEEAAADHRQLLDRLRALRREVQGRVDVRELVEEGRRW